MELKKLLKANLFKATVFAGTLISVFSANAQTELTVDANAAFIGYVGVINPADNAWLWGSGWEVADLKSVVNTANNTVTLFPNYNLYGSGDDPSYWTNGELGAKIIEASTYVENNSLVGQDVVFSGNVNSNNLVAGYEAHAFIKVMDASYAILSNQTAELDMGNFTITTNVANFPTAAHVQYGFSIKGLNGNPAHEMANGKIEVTAGDPVIEEPGEDETVVTVDTSLTEVGFVGVFNPADNAWLWGSAWGVPDLRSDVNDGNNTITLYPNYNLYGSGDDPSYWTNGEFGAKIVECSTYWEGTGLLGQTITFEGNTLSNSLINAYDAQVFIKVMDATFNMLDYQHEALVGGTAFSVTSHAENFPTAANIQYGFSVKGLNGNPAHLATNGFAVVGAATASAVDFSKKAVVMFPNPATNVLNFSSENAIDTIEIYNIMGQKVVSAKPSQNAASVDVSGLTNGVYIVNTMVNGKQNAARFIKQ